MDKISENYAPKKNKKFVDKEVVFQLAAIMCTNDEIGQVLGLSPTAIKMKYAKIIEQGRAEGKKSLRRAQFQVALEKKDVRMLIHLGKNLLGQTDSGDSGEQNQPLPWEEAE